jgi:hypothetical protein
MITFGLTLPHYGGLFPATDGKAVNRTRAALSLAHRLRDRDASFTPTMVPKRVRRLRGPIRW